MKIACLIGVTAYAWVAASSALLLLLLGHLEAFTFPYAQWFWLAPYYAELGHWGSAFVIGSGLAPAIVPIIPLAGSAIGNRSSECLRIVGCNRQSGHR